MQQILEIGSYKQIQNVNYKIVELIGYGAQSLIYKVQDNVNQLLVMKHMRNCDFAMINILEKLKKNQFRFVLNIISYEACNQQPPYTDLFIISEFLQFTLENFKDNIDYEMLIQQSFFGLGEIFDMGASHNDIKPDNIFFSLNEDKSLNLKIGDFGLLCFEKQTKVEYYLQQGTLYYRAPEIESYQDFISLQQKQANDIWGLGLTLYYVLTKENFYELNLKDKLKDSNFIDDRISKVDKKFQAYLTGCLNLDYQKRLQYLNNEYNHLVVEYSIINQSIQKIKIHLRREYQKPQPELYHKILKYLENQQIAEQSNNDQKVNIKELQKQIQQIIQDDVQEQFYKIIQQLNK